MSRELLLNPSRWIILAEIAPPPSIRVGSERVVGHNVRWGRGASALRIIHLLGLRRQYHFLVPTDSAKSGGRRTLHLSVPVTVSQYYALATSPLGGAIAQVVRYGPCAAHVIVFGPSLDVVRSRFANENTLATPNALHFLPRIQMDILNKKGAARLASHDLSQDPSREFIQEAGHGEARRRSSRCSSVIDTGAAPRWPLRVRAGRPRGDHARPDLDG